MLLHQNYNNNNAFFINNNNVIINRSPFINNNMMNNNMMNNNQFQIKNGTTTFKRDLKLNKILEIGSMIPINNCSGLYTDKEYDEITQTCVTAVRENVENISKFCTERIKEKLKGQWFVLIQDANNKNSEFSFTKINFKNILSFQYSDKIFYISRLNKSK